MAGHAHRHFAGSVPAKAAALALCAVLGTVPWARAQSTFNGTVDTGYGESETGNAENTQTRRKSRPETVDEEGTTAFFGLRGTTSFGSGLSPAALLGNTTTSDGKKTKKGNAAATLYPSTSHVFESSLPKPSSAPEPASLLPGPVDASGNERVESDGQPRVSTDAAATGFPAPQSAPEADDIVTGRIGTVDAQARQAQQKLDELDGYGRQNGRSASLDGVKERKNTDADKAPGIRIGTLTLRPTIGERIVHETINEAKGSTSRVYSETTVSGTLTSDWSRHALTVNGKAAWQENLSGTGTELPTAAFDAELRLDLLQDTTATLSAAYGYGTESVTDPNAIAGATSQSGIHTLTAGASLARTAGILRGTAGLSLTRTVYGAATLSDGSTRAVDDRDTLGIKLKARAGYALSPALVPFLEASVERIGYDQKIDSTGTERASTSMALKAGAEVNFGEKLSGELGIGYVFRNADAAALSDFGGVTVDGKLNWSPLRGTTVSAELETTLEASTSAGQSGSIVYEFEGSVTQEVTSDFEARFGATAGYRDYAPGSTNANQYSYGANAGIDWRINRWLSVDADASYTRTVEPFRQDSETIRAGVGLKLRR